MTPAVIRMLTGFALAATASISLLFLGGYLRQRDRT